MDKLPDLWQATPKVHKVAFRTISAEMLSTWTVNDIWDKLTQMYPNMDQDDRVLTWRALRVVLYERRGYSPHFANQD